MGKEYLSVLYFILSFTLNIRVGSKCDLDSESSGIFLSKHF